MQICPPGAAVQAGAPDQGSSEHFSKYWGGYVYTGFVGGYFFLNEINQQFYAVGFLGLGLIASIGISRALWKPPAGALAVTALNSLNQNEESELTLLRNAVAAHNITAQLLGHTIIDLDQIVANFSSTGVAVTDLDTAVISTDADAKAESKEIEEEIGEAGDIEMGLQGIIDLEHKNELDLKSAKAKREANIKALRATLAAAKKTKSTTANLEDVV